MNIACISVNATQLSKDHPSLAFIDEHLKYMFFRTLPNCYFSENPSGFLHQQQIVGFTW